MSHGDRIALPITPPQRVYLLMDGERVYGIASEEVFAKEWVEISMLSHPRYKEVLMNWFYALPINYAQTLPESEPKNV